MQIPEFSEMGEYECKHGRGQFNCATGSRVCTRCAEENNGIPKCPRCGQDMGFASTEWNDDSMLFMDQYACYECDEHWEEESEDQEPCGDPYREVEEENCRHLR